MTPPTQASNLSPGGVADFIIVVSNDDDIHASYHHFTEKVNRKLKAGYQLHGQPFNINQILCQAMVCPAGVEPVNDTTMFSKNPSGYHT
jgi:hypothetical protein